MSTYTMYTYVNNNKLLHSMTDLWFTLSYSKMTIWNMSNRVCFFSNSLDFRQMG